MQSLTLKPFLSDIFAQFATTCDLSCGWRKLSRDMANAMLEGIKLRLSDDEYHFGRLERQIQGCFSRFLNVDSRISINEVYIKYRGGKSTFQDKVLVKVFYTLVFDGVPHSCTLEMIVDFFGDVSICPALDLDIRPYIGRDTSTLGDLAVVLSNLPSSHSFKSSNGWCPTIWYALTSSIPVCSGVFDDAWVILMDNKVK